MMADPRLIVTVGLHGSASTWVFNVVRELMIARHGGDRVVALFSDNAGELLTKPELAGRHVVWKTHHGGREWEVLTWLTRPLVVLSIRDPRDAAISLMQRFDMNFSTAIQAVALDCRLAMQCTDTGCLTLRYEDRFFDDPAVLAELMRQTGADIPTPERQRIFAAYRTDAIRDFAAAMSDREYDPVTQIHRTHIGDGRTGKWRERVAPQSQPELTRFFAPFLERFGYEP